MRNVDVLEVLSKNPWVAPLLFWDGQRTTVAAKQSPERGSKYYYKLPSEVEEGEPGYFKALCSTFDRQLGGVSK